MEIHAPEKPIHSTKDFMVHMLTVVLGILIALGLEGIVEWAHHRALVREARENITAEVRKNKQTIDAALPEIQSREKDLKHIIEVMQLLRSDRNAFKHGSMNFIFTNHDLYSTAWHTAATSGAVTYMGYDELRQYTDVYLSQEAFSSLEDQAWRSTDSVGALIEVTMAEDLKKVRDEEFQQIAQEAYKSMFVQQALEGLCGELSKAYKDILEKK